MDTTQLASILQTLSTGGITVGGILGLSFIMLNRGIIWVKPAVDQLIKRHSEAITTFEQQNRDALAAQKEQFENRIREIIAGKDELRALVQAQLTQANTDKQALADALARERKTYNVLATKVVGEVVPYIQVSSKHLQGIEQLAQGVDLL